MLVPPTTRRTADAPRPQRCACGPSPGLTFAPSQFGRPADGASRSEAMKVAVGFSPRTGCTEARRRVATLEWASSSCLCLLSGVATQRTPVPTSIRGLKSTATFTRSLRDLSCGRSASAAHRRPKGIATTTTVPMPSRRLRTGDRPRSGRRSDALSEERMPGLRCCGISSALLPTHAPRTGAVRTPPQRYLDAPLWRARFTAE